jgi:sulfate/thiosulfate transport system substrate-binding protein
MRRISFVVVALGVAAALAGLAGAAGRDTKLALVAYSTPKEAFSHLIPAFQATPAGKGVSFTQSYGASGDQARSIVAGLPADVVDLSLAPDVDTLVQAGLVDKNWSNAPHNGIVSDSVIVFVLRNGNPKHIKTWDDLIKPGVQVVTPNPFTSGGARWNVMAAYGAQLREGKTPKQATAYLNKLFHNVVSQDTSARTALQTFLAGKGDVLLDYENEAILAQRANQPVYYLIPKATILVENPAAVTKTAAQAAKDFLTYLRTPAAQLLFGQSGYRPVDPTVRKKFTYPFRPQLFTIKYVGGWDKVTKQFFDPKTGIVAKIEQGLGVSTGG